MAPSKTSRRERSTGPWALSASPITAPIFVAAFLIAGAQPAHAAGMVGDGTPASCTEAALDAALAGGGLVTFNCGAAPVTIILTAEKTITEEMGETIVDGASLVTLSGGGTTRIFNVTGGGMLEVQKLIIANGSVAGNDQGGSIENFGTLTVTNSTFAGNSAFGGGAIDNYGGILTLANCTLSGNSAVAGGAIFNAGSTATLTDCALSGNSAAGGFGGAIVNLGGSLTLTNCTLNQNTAAGTEGYLNGAGGAICNLGTLTLTNSTLSGNSARRGGGMANYPGPSPAGCFGDSVVVNSTFSGNQADLGAGAIDAPCQTSVTNSIIANSSGANCGNGLDGSPAITDGGHNIQFPDTSCGETIPSLDPLLDPAGLKDNGGPTQTIALLPNSPAVNAGDEAVCGAAPVNGLDQRGYQRPGGGYTNCSIGAFEYSGPGPTPTPTATSTPPATATLTPSQPPVSTPTATGKAGGGGGGCTVTPSHSGGAAWWLLAPALVLARARRGRARAVPK